MGDLAYDNCAVLINVHGNFEIVDIAGDYNYCCLPKGQMALVGFFGDGHGHEIGHVRKRIVNVDQ